MQLQFYKILKQLRTDKGISQQQLSKDIGCSQSIITKWELNKREPTAQALIALSQYFDVTIEFLLGIENEFGNSLVETNTLILIPDNNTKKSYQGFVSKNQIYNLDINNVKSNKKIEFLNNTEEITIDGKRFTNKKPTD